MEQSVGASLVLFDSSGSFPRAGDPRHDHGIHIAGDAIKNWTPGATPLTQVDATYWTYSQALAPGQTVQYIYTLGDWPYVETNADGSDVSNRQITVADQGGGAMIVSDTVAAWKAVP